MGNANSSSLNSLNKLNFEGMQQAINKNNVDNKEIIIISTLSEDNQQCLINNTISAEKEVNLLNEYLNDRKHVPIIIYGKNNCDEKIFLKYQQLTQLGFMNVYIYIGGIFEWLLLQEVYGEDQFPTTIPELDILKYK